MKKILSILLALALIIGLIPTAFADDTAPETEPTSVTYSFTTTGHDDLYTSNGDRMEYARNDIKRYTNLYPSTTKGGAWAYLGTTTNSCYTSDDTYRIAHIDDTRTLFTLAKDTYIAFKIQVPTSGTYKVEDFKPYLVKNNTTTDMKMYIVPMTQELEKKLNATDGTAWGTKTYDSTSKVVSRINVLTFEQLGITASPLGEYSLISDTKGVASVDISSFDTVTMEANTDYALILHSDIGSGNSTGISSLTVTKIIPEPSASLTAQSYETYDEGTIAFTGKLTAADGVTDITSQATAVKFESSNIAVAMVDNNGVVTGVATGTANITVTYTYGGKNYSATVPVTITDIVKDKTYEISEATENSVWSWVELGKIDVVKDAYLQIIGRKDYYHNESADYSRAAIKINVAYSGTYDISARIKTATSGTEADVYIIPATVDVGELTFSYLKGLPIIGRANGVGDGSNITRFIGTTELAAGDYYVIFNFNGGNISTGNYNKQSLNIINLQFAESDGEATETHKPASASTPSFMAVTNIPSLASVTVTGAGEGPIHSVERGKTVTLSIPEKVEGYNFVGWMRGAYKDNGEFSKFVDLSKNEVGTYSYNVWSSIYLTAVYEPAGDSDEPGVRFWNNDGSYLDEIKVSKLDANDLPTASLIGHTFVEWWVDESQVLDITKLTAAVTNAVAQYTAKTTRKTDTAAKKYDEVSVNGVVQSDVAYGTAIPCKDKGGNVTHWLRDGKIVSYNPEYIHYVWDGTNIYSSYAPVEKKPLVVLENTTIDGASMIEYDGAGKEIVEVGILFGEAGSTPVIGSTFDKYISQRSDNHGQLAAKPINEDYTVARGYMIYIDNGNTYVIYSE